jgi:serine/threonine protein kinase
MLLTGIIHGDIKPENVLLFKGDNGSYTAKVADFGFSTWGAQDNTGIVLPQSWPWYAPECDEYPEFTSVRAIKTDVFSFGMLCLWFMFEKYLSGVLPLPEATRSERIADIYEGKHRSLKFLADLKKRGVLAKFANQLVAAEAGLDAEMRQILQHFFGGCLARDPEARVVDIQHITKHLNIQQ